MAQSFQKRFAGREAEVIDEIRLLGWGKFCEREHISGFGLQGWFQKQKGCETDSVYRYISSDNPIHNLPLAKQIMLAIQTERSKHQKSVADYQTRLDETNRQIKFLEEQLRYYRIGEYKNLRPIWEMVRVSNKGDPVEA